MPTPSIGWRSRQSLPARLGHAAVRDTLQWIRGYNRTSALPVRFVGIDVPQAAGSLLPSLHPLREYLAVVDAEGRWLRDAAIGLAEAVSGSTMAQSAPRYLELDASNQDALTAALSRLVDRFEALAPDYIAAAGRDDYDRARWRLEGASAADRHLRGIAAAYEGAALPAAATSRERYVAASVGWWLDHLEPGSRMVLAAHNVHSAHPCCVRRQLQVLPMGLHLDRMLGDDYVAIGVTSAGGRTAALYPAADVAPYGFVVDDAELEPRSRAASKRPSPRPV